MATARKEADYFTLDKNYRQGVSWYRDRMPEGSVGKKIVLEKSPRYFARPKVPERVHAFNSSVRLMLIVREPVQRLISDYTQQSHPDWIQYFVSR